MRTLYSKLTFPSADLRRICIKWISAPAAAARILIITILHGVVVQGGCRLGVTVVLTTRRRRRRRQWEGAPAINWKLKKRRWRRRWRHRSPDSEWAPPESTCRWTSALTSPECRNRVALHGPPLRLTRPGNTWIIIKFYKLTHLHNYSSILNSICQWNCQTKWKWPIYVFDEWKCPTKN